MSGLAVEGRIERRLLINYRVDPKVLAAVVPAPFRPQLVEGMGVAGICLIRLGHLRPRGLPAWTGMTTENAAHRMAVEWDGPDGVQGGVYIPRRDTSSRLSAVVGGRLFPSGQHLARFSVHEGDGRFHVAFESADGLTGASVIAVSASGLAPDSVFGSLAAASAFFEAAPSGFSSTAGAGGYDSIGLCCPSWRVSAVAVEEVRSRFFDDLTRFPAGSIHYDSALLMRDLPALWEAQPRLAAAGAGRRRPAAAGMTR